MSKILVTGGLGFIGTHLCKKLVSKGDEVFCLDDLSTGKISKIDAKIIIHDICRPIDIKADQIYNLACPASPVSYQRDPIQTTKTNVLGAINVLDLANKYGAKILQASTSEVYGNPLEHPQSEGYCGNVNPIGIRGCYDEGKRCAESLFFDYHRTHKTKIKVVRIFNTYGPGMAIEDGRVIPNFISQAIKNENIIIYGDGKQTRCFCYIDDLIGGLISMMGTKDHITGPINLGNEHEVDIKTLAAKIIKLTGSRSKIAYIPPPQDDPYRRKPDVSKALKELDWKPKIDLDEGLMRTIEYFRNVIFP